METINVNLENLSEEKQEQLMALIAEGNKPKSKRFKPEIGEIYWFIDGLGDVVNDTWGDDAFDEYHYKTHNCFKTEEEAEFKREQDNVHYELLNYAEEHNEGEIDWKDLSQEKWFLVFDYEYNRMDIYRTLNCVHMNQIYFTRERIAKSAIKAVGEDRTRKYLFNVED